MAATVTDMERDNTLTSLDRTLLKLEALFQNLMDKAPSEQDLLSLMQTASPLTLKKPLPLQPKTPECDIPFGHRKVSESNKQLPGELDQSDLLGALPLKPTMRHGEGESMVTAKEEKPMEKPSRSSPDILDYKYSDLNFSWMPAQHSSLIRTAETKKDHVNLKEVQGFTSKTPYIWNSPNTTKKLISSSLRKHMTVLKLPHATQVPMEKQITFPAVFDTSWPRGVSDIHISKALYPKILYPT